MVSTLPLSSPLSSPSFLAGFLLLPFGVDLKHLLGLAHQFSPSRHLSPYRLGESVPALRVRPHPGLVDQQVRVARHSRPLPHVCRKQLRELARVAPAALALIEHQRHDRAQVLLVRVPPAIPFPDPDAVLQQPQPQPGVRRRPVLQQHVQPRRCAAALALDRVQQVGFAVAQAVVDEADRLPPEARPHQFTADRLRQVCPQQAGRLGLLSEHGTEQVIVGLGNLAGHDSAATVLTDPSRCQRSIVSTFPLNSPSCRRLICSTIWPDGSIIACRSPPMATVPLCARRPKSEPKRRSVFDPPKQFRSWRF